MSTSTSIGRDALMRAIEVHGLAELARRLDVSYQLIQGWAKEDRKFATPAEYCPLIEKATKGVVRCEELRPDVEWAVLRRIRRDRAVA